MNRQTLANDNVRPTKGKMNHNQTSNRSCPTSINVAANSKVVANDSKTIINHDGSNKASKQICAPISKIISSRCSSLRGSNIGIGDGTLKDVRSHLPNRACDVPPKCQHQRPRDIFDGYGHVPPSHNDCDAKASTSAKKSHKRSSHGPKLRSLWSHLKKQGAAMIRRAQPASNFLSPPNKYPSSDLPSMMTPNVSRENAFQPTDPHQGFLDFQVRTHINNARNACSHNLNYQTGQMLHHCTHALPFPSSSHAHAMLNKLPIDSPLFANWKGEWTYGRLSGRFEDSCGDMCAIVVFNKRGDAKEIFKKENWRSCIMLVNWNTVCTPSLTNVPGSQNGRVALKKWDLAFEHCADIDFAANNSCRNNARDRCGGPPTSEGATALSPSLLSPAQPAKSVSFQCATKVPPPPRPHPPSHSALPGSNNGARRIVNTGRASLAIEDLQMVRQELGAIDINSSFCVCPSRTTI